jgi:hypothetical protein
MKRTILQLLVADIKHNQLLNGLYDIGFYDNDLYMLNIDFIVAEMMGVSPMTDVRQDLYHKTMLEVRSSITEEERLQIAEELYDRLVNI